MKVHKLSESFHFNRIESEVLEEDLLVEAPAIVDKIKKGINSITQSTDEKELAKAEKQKKKIQDKSTTLLAKDLSSKNAQSTFYIDHDYRNGMSQNDWKAWVAKAKKLSENPKNETTVARMKDQRANAIVVDSDGFYMRRGLENLENKYVRFEPGTNDELSSGYHTDNYSYKRSIQKAASKNSKLDVRKLQDICKLTGIQVIGEDRKPLTLDSIEKLTSADISKLKIQPSTNHAPVNMERWLSAAKKAKLI